jgi:glycogen debranching enzyme
MDAVVNGTACYTERRICLVNKMALWYNAVCFALAQAEEAKDRKFIREYENAAGN